MPHNPDPASLSLLAHALIALGIILCSLLVLFSPWARLDRQRRASARRPRTTTPGADRPATMARPVTSPRPLNHPLRRRHVATTPRNRGS